MASFPTTVKTFTAKTDNVDDVRASHVNDLQDEVNAIESFLYKHNARANRATAQTFANSVVVIVDYGTVVFDPESKVTVGASWKYTAPVTGKYQVSAMLNFYNPAGFAVGESIVLLVYKNGAEYCTLDAQYDHDSSSAHSIVMHGTTLVDLAATDYVDFRIYQTSGGSIDSAGSFASQCWCSIALVGL